MTAVAGTPCPLAPAASPEALAELDFDRVLEVVARRAVSPLGAAAVRARVPAATLDDVRAALLPVAELATVLRDGAGFAPAPVSDLRQTLRALQTPGSVLQGAELAELGRALEAMRRTAHGLAGLAESAPRVAALAVDLPPKKLDQSLDRALEPDGTVKDDASVELRRARRRVRESRARLIRQLEGLLRELGADAGGGEAEVRVRNGRYVVPIRREARSRVRGIVHGESSSGATLFVEPGDAVELGNDLAEAQAEEARAVVQVLRDLTEAARPHSDRIEAGFEMCVRADDLYARARYAREVDAFLPRLADRPGRLVIRHGVHPLLRDEAAQPVSFDLDLTDGETTLVVSGPNAGGKTVLLKAVGLVSALAQSGVIPPVGPESELPVFRRIFVDIGDHQSIAASLSTYSAHLSALKAILGGADAHSLVLLDELGGGTDPIEGGALAGAVLLALARRRVTTVATTHLTQLKELAARGDGLVNASLEFNAETLTPTFRLLKGQPGRSYALAMARRLGLPADVLGSAEELTPAQVRSLDAMLAELERREIELTHREGEVDAAAARLTRDTAAAARDREEIAQRLAGLDSRERELERTGREEARRFLLEARRRVEEALGLARAAVTEATAKEARRLVEEGVREEADALKKLARAARTQGWKIRTKRGERSAQPDVGAPVGAQGAVAPPEPPPAATEIDLRGMTADEAEAAVVVAIDAAVVEDLPALRIIHGKGTGALRERVGVVLRRDRRVRGFHLAPPVEGGSGVTIAEFAS